jgi:hypothetical protein
MGNRDVNSATGFLIADHIKEDVDLFSARLNYKFGGPAVGRYRFNPKPGVKAPALSGAFFRDAVSIRFGGRPPSDAVYAHDGGIDHLHRRVMIGSKRIHDLVPDASPPPPNEAIVTGGAGTIGPGQVTPWRARAEDPKSAIEHTTIIYPANAARLIRQHRLDRGPFIIAEFMAHDSRLGFWELESLPPQYHQAATAGGEAVNALNLLPLSAA